MLFRIQGGTAAVTFLAAATAVAAAAAVASCATQGQGTNDTFTDGSADGTQPEASSSGSGSGSGSSSGGSGCDADTMGDPYNCGSCGHHCPQGNVCSCGQCLAPCAGGMATCCGSCANLMTDPLNCGTCNNPCTNMGSGDITGTAECKGGQCDLTCPDAGPEGGPVISCGADAGGPGCFNPLTNQNACGGCGNVCASGNCKGGICQDASASTTGYATTNPTLPFMDACSMANSKTVVPSASSWTTSGVQTLPFSFTFFGSAQTQFWIGSQATLAFGSTPNSIGFPTCSGSPPPVFTNYPAIVAFGDQNLGTGPSGVCFAETSAPDGGDAGAGAQFVVTWKQATDFNDFGSVLTFSIVLTQGTNTVDFLYETISGADGGLDPNVEGANASVGMQLSSSTNKVYSCNVTFIPSTPYAVRFTPQ